MAAAPIANFGGAVVPTVYGGAVPSLAAVTPKLLLENSPDGNLADNDADNVRLGNGSRALLHAVATTGVSTLRHSSVVPPAGGWWETAMPNGAGNTTTANGQFTVLATGAVAAPATTTLFLRDVDVAGVSVANALAGAAGSGAAFALRGAALLFTAEDTTTAPSPRVLVRVDRCIGYTAPLLQLAITVVTGTFPAITMAGRRWRIARTHRLLDTTLLPGGATFADTAATMAAESSRVMLATADVTTSTSELLVRVGGAVRHIPTEPVSGLITCPGVPYANVGTALSAGTPYLWLSGEAVTSGGTSLSWAPKFSSGTGAALGTNVVVASGAAVVRTGATPIDGVGGLATKGGIAIPTISSSAGNYFAINIGTAAITGDYTVFVTAADWSTNNGGVFMLSFLMNSGDNAESASAVLALARSNAVSRMASRTNTVGTIGHTAFTPGSIASGTSLLGPGSTSIFCFRKIGSILRISVFRPNLAEVVLLASMSLATTRHLRYLVFSSDRIAAIATIQKGKQTIGDVVVFASDVSDSAARAQVASTIFMNLGLETCVIGSTPEYDVTTTVGALANVDAATADAPAADGHILAWDSATLQYKAVAAPTLNVPAVPQPVGMQPDAFAIGPQNTCASGRYERDATYTPTSAWLAVTGSTTQPNKAAGVKVLAAVGINARRVVAAYRSMDSARRLLFIEYDATPLSAATDSRLVIDNPFIIYIIRNHDVVLRFYDAWDDVSNVGVSPKVGIVINLLARDIDGNFGEILTFKTQYVMGINGPSTITYTATAGSIAIGSTTTSIGADVNILLRAVGNRIEYSWDGSGMAHEFDSNVPWNTSRYPFSPRIENANTNPVNLRYDVSSLDNLVFRLANGTSSPPAVTQFTQANVDAGAVIVEITDPVLARHSYTFTVTDTIYGNVTALKEVYVAGGASTCEVDLESAVAIAESRTFARAHDGTGVATVTLPAPGGGDSAVFATAFPDFEAAGFTQSLLGAVTYTGDGSGAARAHTVTVSARLFATDVAGVRLFAYARVGAAEIPGTRCLSFSQSATSECTTPGFASAVALLSPGDVVTVGIAREAGGASQAVSIESVTLTVCRV
jgi:hypothetical protein